MFVGNNNSSLFQKISNMKYLEQLPYYSPYIISRILIKNPLNISSSSVNVYLITFRAARKDSFEKKSNKLIFEKIIHF
jgi:hypothetical protein